MPSLPTAPTQPPDPPPPQAQPTTTTTSTPKPSAALVAPSNPSEVWSQGNLKSLNRDTTSFLIQIGELKHHNFGGQQPSSIAIFFSIIFSFCSILLMQFFWKMKKPTCHLNCPKLTRNNRRSRNRCQSRNHHRTHLRQNTILVHSFGSTWDWRQGCLKLKEGGSLSFLWGWTHLVSHTYATTLHARKLWPEECRTVYCNF